METIFTGKLHFSVPPGCGMDEVPFPSFKVSAGAISSIFTTACVIAGVAGCSVLLKNAPFRYWVYLFLICVPFDLGAAIGYIPRISVVDYLSLAGLIAVI